MVAGSASGTYTTGVTIRASRGTTGRCSASPRPRASRPTHRRTVAVTRHEHAARLGRARSRCRRPPGDHREARQCPAIGARPRSAGARAQPHRATSLAGAIAVASSLAGCGGPAVPADDAGRRAATAAPSIATAVAGAIGMPRRRRRSRRPSRRCATAPRLLDPAGRASARHARGVERGTTPGTMRRGSCPATAAGSRRATALEVALRPAARPGVVDRPLGTRRRRPVPALPLAAARATASVALPAPADPGTWSLQLDARFGDGPRRHLVLARGGRCPDSPAAIGAAGRSPDMEPAPLTRRRAPGSVFVPATGPAGLRRWRRPPAR